jgi:invasion protein IalB
MDTPMKLSLAAAAAALLLSSSMAFAQADSTATPAAAAPAASGTPAAAAPAAPAAPASAAPAAPATPAAPAGTSTDIPEKVQAWAKFCDPQPPKNNTVCIVRKLAFQERSIVGSITIRTDTTKGVPTLAVAAIPVGVVLKPGLRWQIDKSKPQTLPFWRCTPNTCESEQLIKADFINRLKKGTTLTLTAKTVENKDFAISVSLKGFADAFNLKNAPTYADYQKSIGQ